MRRYAEYIDHTLLKPEATFEDIEGIVEEAKTYSFKSVCVNPYWVAFCNELLIDYETLICTVIGFPLGANSSRVKAFETKQAIVDGAKEIDMVLNIGELKAGRERFVLEDIQMVVEAAGTKAIVKVIIETSLLTDDEKYRACQLAELAGADYVKTSTGFAGGGATVHDVEIMKKAVSNTIGIKASGGIRDLNTVEKLIDTGATRIGASSGVQILKGQQNDSSY